MPFLLYFMVIWLKDVYRTHTHTHTQLEKSTDFPGYLKYSPAAVASAFQAVNPGATFPPAHTHPWPGHAQSHAAPGSAHAESHRRVPGSGVETSLSVLCCFWPGPQCSCSLAFPWHQGRTRDPGGEHCPSGCLLVPGTLPEKATGWSPVEFPVVIAQWLRHPWVFKGHCQVLF